MSLSIMNTPPTTIPSMTLPITSISLRSTSISKTKMETSTKINFHQTLTNWKDTLFNAIVSRMTETMQSIRMHWGMQRKNPRFRPKLMDYWPSSNSESCSATSCGAGGELRSAKIQISTLIIWSIVEPSTRSIWKLRTVASGRLEGTKLDFFIN